MGDAEPQQQQPAAATQQQQAPASLDDLPNAALEAILACCCCDGKRTAANLRLVCSRWRAALQHSARVQLPRLVLAAPLQMQFVHQHAKALVELTLKDVDSLGCVGGMQGLQRLCLESCRRVTDLSPLAQLPSLHTLLLRSIRALSDLQPLAQVPQLTALLLDRCSVRDLSPLSAVRGLQSLHLSYDVWAIVVVTFPPTLPALRQLRIMAPLQDLSPLAAYTGLTSLELYAVAVHDLSPLGLLTGLQELDLHHLHEEQSAQDVSVLSTLVSLRALGLQGSDPGIILHTPFAAMTSLTRLDLHGSRVADLRPLRPLTNLRSLGLSQARELVDVGPLSGLTGLDELVLTGSKHVRDLRPVLHLSKALRRP